MENTKTLHALDEFAKTKPKDIPKELEDYLRHVAASGDPLYQWSLVKCLFRQKLHNVIIEFFESCPMMDMAPSPNLDPFNYETMKKRLLDRYDLFSGVPFTIQRIAELLTAPRKQYNRLDKFMRALEKNVWVVSTREPETRNLVDQSLANGVLSSVLHSNNGENVSERLERESDVYDGGDEEDQDANDKSETVERVTADDPIEAIPNKSPAETPSQVLGEPVQVPDPTDLVVVTELEPKVMEEQEDTPQQPLVEKSLVTPESKDPVSVVDPKPDEVEGTTEAIKHDNDSEVDKTVMGLDTTEETKPDNDTEVDETASDFTEKTEEIIVTEVEDTEPVEAVEEIPEPGIVVESSLEQDEENEDKLDQPKEKIDLKRKLDDFIEFDEEQEMSHKKLLSSPGEVLVDQTEAEEQVAESTDSIPAEVEVEEEEKIVEAVAAEVVEITEVEGVMESLDEKIEMVVEEPEQAMEVDEGSTESPMAEEDIVEPMEESELCPS